MHAREHKPPLGTKADSGEFLPQSPPQKSRSTVPGRVLRQSSAVTPLKINEVRELVRMYGA